MDIRLQCCVLGIFESDQWLAWAVQAGCMLTFQRKRDKINTRTTYPDSSSNVRRAEHRDRFLPLSAWATMSANLLCEAVWTSDHHFHRARDRFGQHAATTGGVLKSEVRKDPTVLSRPKKHAHLVFQLGLRGDEKFFIEIRCRRWQKVRRCEGTVPLQEIRGKLETHENRTPGPLGRHPQSADTDHEPS